MKSIDEHTLLIPFIIKKYELLKYGVPYEDMYSEGLLALVEAEKTFDPEKSKLTTHLTNRIYYAILTYCTKEMYGGLSGWRTMYRKNITMRVDTSDELFYSDPTNRIAETEALLNLWSVLKKLPEKYAPAIELILRRLNGEKITQAYMAEKYGVNQIHISRLLNTVKEKMK